VSIIIAGIGDPHDKFKVCIELDGDEEDKGVAGSERDCVQFVSLKECQND
jgi:hypothetical protein